MPHDTKVYYAGFTAPQLQANTLRRQLDAGEISIDQAFQQVLTLLYGTDYIACLRAITMLVEHADEDAVVPLIETVFFNSVNGGSLSRALRCRAIWALGRIAPDDDMVVGTFVAASRDPDPRVASVAAEALAACRMQSKRAIIALRPCLDHDDNRVRSAARGALGQLLGMPVGTA